MMATAASLLGLTAKDLMSKNVVMISRSMSLRAAAKLLSQAQVSGAPVVDAEGQCVGVLSATDFMHLAGHKDRSAHMSKRHEPGCFHSAWQMDDADVLPTDEVGTYMTADPVMVPIHTSIAELARSMTDARIHRVIVVDAQRRPIGVVSSMDILAAVARAASAQP